MTKDPQNEFKQATLFLRKKSGLSSSILQNLVQLSWCVFPSRRQDHFRSVLLITAAWIIVVDKLFESKSVSKKTIHSFRSQVQAVFDGREQKPPRENGLYSTSFALFVSMHDTVMRGRENKDLVRRWKSSIVGFLKGMENERSQTINHLPPLSEYLRNAQESIGSNVALYALLMSYTRKKSSLSVAKFGIIRAMIREASLLLRLANDLGSYQRERKQKKVNSMVIGRARFGSEERAKFFINQMIDKRHKKLQTYKKLTEGTARLFASVVMRIVEFNISLYRMGDYHKNT